MTNFEQKVEMRFPSLYQYGSPSNREKPNTDSNPVEVEMEQFNDVMERATQISNKSEIDNINEFLSIRNSKL